MEQLNNNNNASKSLAFPNLNFQNKDNEELIVEEIAATDLTDQMVGKEYSKATEEKRKSIFIDDKNVIICNKIFTIKAKTYEKCIRSIKMATPFLVLIFLIIILLLIFRIEIFVSSDGDSD